MMNADRETSSTGWNASQAESPALSKRSMIF